MHTDAGSDTTRANSFHWEFDPDGHRGHFARLVPTNTTARNAFHCAVDCIRSAGIFDHETSKHLDSFITAKKKDNAWIGYYGFSMSSQRRRSSSWTFGVESSNVDFLLWAPSEHGQPNPGVFRIHGEFFQDQFAATLMIRAKSKDCEIFLNNALQVALNGRMLTSQGSILIGAALYKLEFTDLRPEILIEQINKTRKEQLVYPSLLTPTPTSASQTIQDKFLVQPTTHGGSQGSVGFGFRMGGGAPIVAKKFLIRRNNGSFERMNQEVHYLKLLRHQDNVVHIAEEFDVDLAMTSHPKTSVVSEITLIIEPAAMHSLQEILDDRIEGVYSVTDIRRIAADWASGLAAIHALPAIHCDLSPNNLGLTAFGGVILDLGHTTAGKTSDNHRAGTVPYLAPEVMNLKRAKDAGTHIAIFGKPVTPMWDVWSLGLAIALWLLHRRGPPWNNKNISADLGVDEHSLASLRNQLDALVKDTPKEGLLDGCAASLKELVRIVKVTTNLDAKYRWKAHEVVLELRKADFTPSPLLRPVLPFHRVSGLLSASSDDY